jgi:hypothetical protein
MHMNEYLELIAGNHSYQYGKHGGMCGLNATNPLDARTPPPFAFSPQLCTRRNKSNANRSQDGLESLGVRRAADLRKA